MKKTSSQKKAKKAAEAVKETPPKPAGGKGPSTAPANGNAAAYTRWAAFERAVLSKVADPQKCRETILRRQQEVDADANESDLVAAYFRVQLRKRELDPETCVIYWTTAEVTEWLAAATGTKLPVNKATPYLRTLSIAELRYTKKTGVPGWVWRGRKAGKAQQPIVYSKLPYIPPG
jgi:hypothetical protein